MEAALHGCQTNWQGWDCSSNIGDILSCKCSQTFNLRNFTDTNKPLGPGKFVCLYLKDLWLFIQSLGPAGLGRAALPAPKTRSLQLAQDTEHLGWGRIHSPPVQMLGTPWCARDSQRPGLRDASSPYLALRADFDHKSNPPLMDLQTKCTYEWASGMERAHLHSGESCQQL